MKLSQEKIDEIRKAAKQFAICFGVSAGILLIAGRILMIWEDTEWCQMVAFMSVYMAEALGTLGILIALGWLFIKLRIAERNQAQTLDEQLSSHLIGVTPEQEKQILRLLKRAAKPSDGSNKMNRSEVATLLATLKSLGLLEDAGDYNNLRLWVENVTGLKDDDKVHFNEAYKRAMDKKGDTRYTSDLEKILENYD